jgi:hypothetical protein
VYPLRVMGVFTVWAPASCGSDGVHHKGSCRRELLSVDTASTETGENAAGPPRVDQNDSWCRSKGSGQSRADQ